MRTITLRSAARGTTSRVGGVKSLPTILSPSVTARVMADLGGRPDGPQSHDGYELLALERDGQLHLETTSTPAITPRSGRPNRGPVVRLSLAVGSEVGAWLRARGNVSREVERLVRAEIARERGEHP